MKLNLGKYKKGARYQKFIWGTPNFSEDILPSSTTCVITKDYTKRKQFFDFILQQKQDNIITINLNHDNKFSSNYDLVKTVTLLEEVKNYINGLVTSNEQPEKEIFICYDDYDLDLFSDNHKAISKIKECINYINDFGLRYNVFLLLGCNNAINCSQFINTFVDNIILLKPYDISLLYNCFDNSLMKVINKDNPIQQFCEAYSIKINQTTKEPNIIKNGNNIWVFSEN